MRLRAVLLLLLFALAALAGCLSTGDDGEGETPAGEADPYVLDCSIGGNGGPDWTEPCLALASPNDSPSKTEIDLVVNPLDPTNVVVASKDKDPLASPDCVWAVAQVSKDGGRTWNTSYVGGTMDEREPGDLLYGYECITDPIMTFNKDGDLFYNLQAYRQENDPPNPGGLPGPDVALMAMAVSRDGGESWPEIIPEQFGDDLTIFPDYMHMGTSPVTGSVFAIWNTITGLVMSHPTLVAYRAGQGFTQPWIFWTPDAPTGLGESGVVGASDGTVYACLCGFNSGGRAFWSTSTDDGVTWSTPELVWEFAPMGSLEGAEFRSGTVVEIAIDTSGGPRDGCIYGAWGGSDRTEDGDPADIYVRTSCDGGASWSDIIEVAPGTSADGQWMPRITVDGRGGVHIVYLTRHYDPEHFLIDAEWAYSTDGGTNWTTKRLTATSFDGNLGIHQDNFPFLGDYIGIGASGDHVYMGFPTTVTGRAEIAVAHVVYGGDGQGGA